MNVHKNAKMTPVGRVELVKRVLFEKESVSEVAHQTRVSERTVRKWVRRYEARGWRA